MFNEYKIGQIGYEAYCESVGGKSAITGDPLPHFDDCPPEVRYAWMAAGSAMLEFCDDF